MPASYLADDARHRIRMTGAVERGAGIIDINAFESSCEAIRIALTPHFAVGDDVESSTLLIEDSDPGGVVLRLVKKFGRDPPQLLCAHPRWEPASEVFSI